MLGERVEGAIVAEQVEGEIRRVIDAESDGQVRFAPMVVNQAGRPLRVAVVGPTDSVDCDCRVATGDSLRLGYYRYTDGTGLRVTDSRGWSARLTDLDDRRDPVSGAVVVRVSRADLRPPARDDPPGQDRRSARSRAAQPAGLVPPGAIGGAPHPAGRASPRPRRYGGGLSVHRPNPAPLHQSPRRPGAPGDRGARGHRAPRSDGGARCAEGRNLGRRVGAGPSACPRTTGPWARRSGARSCSEEGDG